MSNEAEGTGTSSKPGEDIYSYEYRHKKFTEHQGSVRNRYDRNGCKVLFKLSFDEWDAIWQASGRWQDRGRTRGCYCMSRYNDLGHYELGNVFIQPIGDNTRESNARYTHSEEVRRKISANRKLQHVATGPNHWNAKAIMTPDGEFETIRLAAKHYGCTAENLGYRIKKKKEGWYLL